MGYTGKCILLTVLQFLNIHKYKIVIIQTDFKLIFILGLTCEPWRTQRSERHSFAFKGFIVE